MSSRHTLSVPPSSSLDLRSNSPSASSSSSSSISTTSTHTVVPSRHCSHLNSTPPITRLTPTSVSTTSLSSDSTDTVLRPTRHSFVSNPSSTKRLKSPSRSRFEAVTVRPANTSSYALLKASLAPYLTTSNVTTFFLLFVVFPFISFIIRAQHRRRKALTNGGSSVTNNVDVVRRRLRGVDAGFLGRVWTEFLRAVSDTAKMAGSGLV